jgi:hypothetical protein
MDNIGTDVSKDPEKLAIVEVTTVVPSEQDRPGMTNVTFITARFPEHLAVVLDPSLRPEHVKLESRQRR